jgi:hypothetical protein
MDDLQRRREREADQHAARDGSQVGKLAARDRETQRQDTVAEGRDDAAKAADQDADARDRAAEHRDATADAWDGHLSAAGPSTGGERQRARQDRADAAHDRDKSVDDRARARRDRKVSKQDRERAVGDRSAAWEALAAIRLMLSDAEDDAEDMLLIGRAQGIIMQSRGLPPTQALLELCAQASQNETTLADISRDVVGKDGSA